MGGDGTREVLLSIALTAAQCQQWYAGRVTHVQLQAADGVQYRLPLNLLRPHLGHAGVQGRFRLLHDATGKCLSLERLV